MKDQEVLKLRWVVYQLTEAVSGIGNKGIEYDDHAFILSRYHKGIFKTEEEAYFHVSEQMKDYKKRKVDKGVRFVVMPTMCFSDDDIFQDN